MNGTYDGVVFRVRGLETKYPNLKMISIPLFTVQHVVFSKEQDMTDQVHDFRSLAEHAIRNNHTVGFLRGSRKAEAELSELPEKNKFRLDSPEQGFGMLELGRIDAYLAGSGIVNRIILKKRFAQSGIQEVGVFSEFPLFPYVHMRHATVIPKLEKAMKAMTDDGTLDGIRNSLEE